MVSPDQLSLGRQTLSPPFLRRPHGAPQSNIIAREGSFALYSSKETGFVSITQEWMPSSKRSKPNTYCIGYFGARVDVLAGQPLSQRAWTLQETSLSPRVLHLCEDQLFWSCQRGMVGEDGCHFESGPFPINTVIERQALPRSEYGLCGDHTASLIGHTIEENGQQRHVPIEGFPPSSPSYGRWDRGWLAVVEDFSTRNISEPADKLPALSGLAHAIFEKTGERYLAGLWEDHVLEDLCWRVHIRDETIMQRVGGFTYVLGNVFRAPALPSKYRAPTWSWASLDANIMFIPLDYTRILADLVDYYINYTTADRMGQVGEGSCMSINVRAKQSYFMKRATNTAPT